MATLLMNTTPNQESTSPSPSSYYHHSIHDLRVVPDTWTSVRECNLSSNLMHTARQQAFGPCKNAIVDYSEKACAADEPFAHFGHEERYPIGVELAESTRMLIVTPPPAFYPPVHVKMEDNNNNMGTYAYAQQPERYPYLEETMAACVKTETLSRSSPAPEHIEDTGARNQNMDLTLKKEQTRAEPSAASMPMPVVANPVYEIVRFLNQGSFGTVHLARETNSGTMVAIKEMVKNRQNASAVRREVEISQLLRHPYIIHTYQVIETFDTVYMVQEFAENGDLFDYIENSGVAGGDEDQVKLWFLQVVSALTYMHDVVGIVHRDVKPENIVIHSNMLDVRLLDFGLARFSSPVTRESVRGRAGTDPYMAEEVFAMAETDYVDGRAADVWSLGVTLFAMLIGQFPWQAASRDHEAYLQYRTRHELTRLRHGRGLFCGAVFTVDPLRLGFTRHICELLDRMLAPNAADRIAVRDISAYCDLSWFTPAHPLYEPLYTETAPVVVESANPAIRIKEEPIDTQQIHDSGVSMATGNEVSKLGKAHWRPRDLRADPPLPSAPSPPLPGDHSAWDPLLSNGQGPAQLAATPLPSDQLLNGSLMSAMQHSLSDTEQRCTGTPPLLVPNWAQGMNIEPLSAHREHRGPLLEYQNQEQDLAFAGLGLVDSGLGLDSSASLLTTADSGAMLSDLSGLFANSHGNARAIRLPPPPPPPVDAHQYTQYPDYGSEKPDQSESQRAVTRKPFNNALTDLAYCTEDLFPESSLRESAMMSTNPVTPRKDPQAANMMPLDWRQQNATVDDASQTGWNSRKRQQHMPYQCGTSPLNTRDDVMPLDWRQQHDGASTEPGQSFEQPINDQMPYQFGSGRQAPFVFTYPPSLGQQGSGAQNNCGFGPNFYGLMPPKPSFGCHLRQPDSGCVSLANSAETTPAMAAVTRTRLAAGDVMPVDGANLSEGVWPAANHTTHWRQSKQPIGEEYSPLAWFASVIQNRRDSGVFM